jgi:small subunit ribosomal protein S8
MDTIANMMAALKNAGAMEKETVTVHTNKTITAMLQVLKKFGYIIDVKLVDGSFPQATVTLAYDEQGKHMIQHLKRLSKPSRRWYVKYHEIPHVRYGKGFCIVSTSNGIMVGDEARSRKLGGELICEVY